MTFYKWSKTAASNASADPTINWSEGQAPSSVNDSARAQMAADAKWRDDISGTLTTTGSSTAYALTTNQSFSSAALMSGAMLCFIPHATSGAAPTLSVDSLTARAINISTGVAVPTGALIAGTPYVCSYIHASTEFILQGVLGAYDGFQLLSTDAGAGVGPTLDLYRNSASPAASDFIGSVDFNGKDSAANKQLYAEIVAQVTDPTSASEDAILILRAVVAGVLTDMLKTSAAGIVVPGTLSVTGASALTGDVAVNTNKLTVTASSGNLASAGTITATGALSGATAAGTMVATQSDQEVSTATDRLVCPGVQQFHPSAAKWWLKSIVSGGTPGQTASYNVTSLTDVGTAQLGVTIGTDFSSGDWVCVVAVQSAPGAAKWGTITTTTQTAGAIELWAAISTTTAGDPASWHAVGYGDQ